MCNRICPRMERCFLSAVYINTPTLRCTHTHTPYTHKHIHKHTHAHVHMREGASLLAPARADFNAGVFASIIARENMQIPASLSAHVR